MEEHQVLPSPTGDASKLISLGYVFLMMAVWASSTRTDC